MKKFKIGVMGVSAHFLKRILPALKRSSLISLEAIASRSKEKAEMVTKELRIPKVYGRYEELLQDEDIDCIYIPLPNHLHYEWIEKCAIAKKHVICEKPLGLNTREIEKCLELASKHRVSIMEAFMYKFHPQWQRVREIIRTGEIGNISSIHCFFGYFNLDENDIRNKIEYGGGAIRDIGCYPISVSRFISDKEPCRVISLIRRDENFKTDCLASAMLDFGDFHSVFTVSTQSVNEQKVYIYGTIGVIEVLLPFNAYTDVPISIRVKTPLGVRKILFEKVDQYLLEFEAFASSIIRNEEPPISLKDSLNNQRIIDAIFESELKKGWIILQ